MVKVEIDHCLIQTLVNEHNAVAFATALCMPKKKSPKTLFFKQPFTWLLRHLQRLACHAIRTLW